MTWPRQYGGAERTFLERYVVTEELLASGAPVSLHWAGDRQSGPLLLKYGTEAQKQHFLPKIVEGEIFFSISMSEPNSGSDLASIRTSATKTDGGWLLNGSKIWTKDEPEFHGEFVDFDPIWSYPKPVTPGGPPVWLGAALRGATNTSSFLSRPKAKRLYCQCWTNTRSSLKICVADWLR